MTPEPSGTGPLVTADGLLSWLKTTITADLEAARAADKVAPGPWVNRGQAGYGDAWQVHGAPTGETDWDPEADAVVPVLSRVATLNYSDGGGVWEREAADHIVLQQPRDTIARCEAELKLLDEFLGQVDALDYIAYSEGQGALGETSADLLSLLAFGYRHRPGFNPDWLEA